MGWLWLEFLAVSAAILYGGTRLLICGDAIARHTRLGSTWVGMALLATVTSLPELVSGATAVTRAQAPNVAVGDVLGSCVFNLAMIAVVDTMQPRATVFGSVGRGHLISGAFGIFALALVAGWIGGSRGAMPWVPPSWLLVIALPVIYALAMRTAYVQESQRHKDDDPGQPEMSLRAALKGYAIASVIVVVAAVRLPFVAVDLARTMGWTTSFVGTLMVAGATSLPELAVTLAAIRRGAVDMAIGNLLGSNLFNMVVLAMATALWLPADLLRTVSPAHLASAISAILMSAAVMVALAAPPRMRLLNAVSWIGALLVAIFFANSWTHMKMAG